MTCITLPFPPPLNALYRNVTRRDGKRGGRIKTQRYLTWLRAAGNELLAQRPEPVKGKAAVYIVLGRPDKRKRDIDGMAKGILDLLVSHRVIEDDSLIDTLWLTWSDKVGKDALVTVTRVPA